MLVKPANSYWKKVRNVVTTNFQLDAIQIMSAFLLGQSSPSQPNKVSPTRANIAKMSSYEHMTSCLEISAKLNGANILLNEDVSPTIQSICNAKMGELQAASLRGRIAFFSGTKLVTRMKRTTHSSHDRWHVSGLQTALQIEANLTGSAETGGYARVQANAAGPALGVPRPRRRYQTL